MRARKECSSPEKAQRLIKLTEILVVYCLWLKLVNATKKRKSPKVSMYGYLWCRREHSQCFKVMHLLQNPNSLGHVGILKNTFTKDNTRLEHKTKICLCLWLSASGVGGHELNTGRISAVIYSKSLC